MTRNLAAFLAILLMAACTFSGCILPTSQDAGGSGNGEGSSSPSGETVYQFGKNVAGENGRIPDSFTTKNGNALHLEIGANLAGGYVDVTIKNPAGATAYSKRISGTGQTADAKEIEGMKGTWTVEYDFNSYTGQFGIEITQ